MALGISDDETFYSIVSSIKNLTGSSGKLDITNALTSLENAPMLRTGECSKVELSLVINHNLGKVPNIFMMFNNSGDFIVGLSDVNLQYYIDQKGETTIFEENITSNKGKAPLINADGTSITWSKDAGIFFDPFTWVAVGNLPVRNKKKE